MSAGRPIEIVGGGLAGLSLGLALQRADAHATVIEAGGYPRHRVCGEFITGLAATTIRQLGLEAILADALRHDEVAWYVHGGPARIESLPFPAYGISRQVLDQRLAAAFVAAGGDLRTHERVSNPEPQPGRVLALGRRRGRTEWLGLKMHARGLGLARDLEMHLGHEAYVGLSKIEGETINICGLFRRRHRPRAEVAGGTDREAQHDLLPWYLNECGLDDLASRVAASRVDRSSFCAVAGLEFTPVRAGRGTIRLGDSYAMIPPFTGDGMAMAFQGAALAAGPLLEYARGQAGWEGTCATVNAALRRRFRVRLASAAVLHPFLLRPRQQKWIAALGRARLLPFRALFAVLH